MHSYGDSIKVLFMKESIVLDKKRSVPEIIDDSYRFIKSNFKELFTKLLLGAVPFLMVSVAFSQKISPQVAEDSVLLPMANLLVLFISQSILYCIIYGFMIAKLNDEEYSNEHMWAFLGRNLMMILSTYSSSFIFLVLGFIAFLIPGLYIFVPLSMIYLHRLLTGETFYESFSTLNQLVKSRWWEAFGLLILSNIILSAIGLLFLLPHFMWGAEEGHSSINATLVTSISYSFYYIFSSLVAVPTSMLYFSLKKQ